MRVIEASAPGKAVLCGEYVVLAGAPAVVAALDRRVTVVVTETVSEWHEVSAPGLSDRCWKFSADSDHELTWHEADAANLFGLLSSVWKVLKPETDKGLSISIDSRQLHDPASGAKTGIGSSAAVATSLVAALKPATSGGGDPYKLAQDAHRDFQNGGGSGLDIAASHYGGVVVFTRETMPVSAGWPAGLGYRFLWSGVPADTAARLDKLDARSLTAEASGSAAPLAAISATVVDHWMAGDAAMVQSGIAEFSSLLREFSDEYNLDVFGAGHREITELAAQYGIVYKPCGAGGGDIGVALSVDEDALAAFCDAAAGKGFTPLDVTVDNLGVTTDIKTA